MLTVNWRPQAIVDLIDIVDYIEQDNPQAAQRMESLIRTAALDLSVMPYIGGQGGLRERASVLYIRIISSFIALASIAWIFSAWCMRADNFRHKNGKFSRRGACAPTISATRMVNFLTMKRLC